MLCSVTVKQNVWLCSVTVFNYQSPLTFGAEWEVLASVEVCISGASVNGAGFVFRTVSTMFLFLSVCLDSQVCVLCIIHIYCDV